MDSLQGTIDSLTKRVDDLPPFELLDAAPAAAVVGGGGDDEDSRAEKQRAADRELYLTLKKSIAEAQAELVEAKKWHAYAVKAEQGDGDDDDDDDDDDDGSGSDDGDESSNQGNGDDSGDGDGGMALIAEMERLYEAMDAISADAAESRACKVLAGLGFSGEMQQCVRALSLIHI